MRIYFASPNTHPLAAAVVGRFVLESFAIHWKSYWQYRRSFAGLMLDSGAFTEVNSGIPVNVDDYGAYAAKHNDDYELVVNLDDIGGDVDLSQANERRLRERYGLDPMPVFHQGEPMSVLAEYCARADYIGLGFKRPLLNADHRTAWVEQCFAAVPSGQKVHGFAMTGYMERFPFTSVDSTTWIRDYMGVAHGANGQIGDLARFLTPAEIFEIIMKKWDRMPRCTSWDGMEKPSKQITIFENMR